jgi:hypothetical protein
MGGYLFDNIKIIIITKNNSCFSSIVNDLRYISKYKYMVSNLAYRNNTKMKLNKEQMKISLNIHKLKLSNNSVH